MSEISRMAVPGQAFSRPLSSPIETAAARDARLAPKLVSSAHQFEASLMAELLKPLTSTGIFGEDDDAAGGGSGGLSSGADGSGGALMSFGSEALAKALSEKGGLGIARQVLDHFESMGKTPSGAGGTATRFQMESPKITKVMSDAADKLKEGEPAP